MNTAEPNKFAATVFKCRRPTLWCKKQCKKCQACSYADTRSRLPRSSRSCEHPSVFQIEHHSKLKTEIMHSYVFCIADESLAWTAQHCLLTSLRLVKPKALLMPKKPWGSETASFWGFCTGPGGLLRTSFWFSKLQVGDLSSTKKSAGRGSEL